MLLRHRPNATAEILAAFSPETATVLKTLAEEKASPLNSALLLRFLKAVEDLDRSPLPQLPLELAIIDTTATA
jgi:hypothetical protein